jgi:hypothetical protein
MHSSDVQDERYVMSAEMHSSDVQGGAEIHKSAKPILGGRDDRSKKLLRLQHLSSERAALKVMTLASR